MGVHYVDVELPLFCFRLSAFAVVVNLSLSCLAFILVRRRMHRDVRLNGHALFTVQGWAYLVMFLSLLPSHTCLLSLPVL